MRQLSSCNLAKSVCDLDASIARNGAVHGAITLSVQTERRIYFPNASQSGILGNAQLNEGFKP